MNLEQQVCSLDLAKRLKELGVKQESLFVWTTLEYYAHIPGVQEEPTPCVMSRIDAGERNTLSAFTVAELGEMLPASTDTRRNKGAWFVIRDINEDTHVEKSNTEADARAKCLIYLLEQGIIKAQSLNP